MKLLVEALNWWTSGHLALLHLEIYKPCLRITLLCYFAHFKHFNYCDNVVKGTMMQLMLLAINCRMGHRTLSQA